MENYGLPREVIEDMVREIRNHDKYRALSIRKKEFAKKGNYMLAQMIQIEIDAFEKQTIRECAELYKKRVRSMADIVSAMNKEDSKLMTAYSYGMIMLADAMETMVLEIGQLAKKYQPGFTFHGYDEFVAVGKDIKRYLSIIKGLGGEDKYHLNLYSDMADNLTEMIVNKAKSFMNKINHHEDIVKNVKTDKK